MSTLATAVQARVATQRLVELTRKDSRSSTTVDTTILELAVDDASALFATLTGAAFDSTDSRHIQLGVQGVLAMLIEWRGQDNAWQVRKDWERACAAYRGTTSNRRVQPVTDRTRGPSPDTDADGQPRRPIFDRTRTRSLDLELPPSDVGG